MTGMGGRWFYVPIGMGGMGMSGMGMSGMGM